jgi:hypothetical protein
VSAAEARARLERAADKIEQLDMGYATIVGGVQVHAADIRTIIADRDAHRAEVEKLREALIWISKRTEDVTPAMHPSNMRYRLRGIQTEASEALS